MSQKYVLVCGMCVLSILYLIQSQTYPKEKGHIMTSLNSLTFLLLFQFGIKILKEIIFLLKMAFFLNHMRNVL